MKKETKILLILLLVAVLALCVVAFGACDGGNGGNGGEHEHVYDEIIAHDQYSHYLICSSCGERVLEDHNIEWTIEADNHTYGCTVCNYISSSGNHNFNYDYAAIKSDEEGHYWQCLCGAVTEHEPHVAREIAYLADEQGHWKFCEICGGEYGEQAHSDNDTCNVCSYSNGYYTEGLKYWNSGSWYLQSGMFVTSYYVEGIGTATDKDIVIPSFYNGCPVVGIQSNAFEGANIESVVIPDRLETIGNHAFSSCDALVRLTIGKGVTSIGDEVFSQCFRLKNVQVDGDNANYASQGGILYNKAKTQILHVPYAIEGDVVISDGVTAIDELTFADRDLITSVQLPESVTKIGQLAFYNCIALVQIDIPNSVTEIGRLAFYYCISLKEIHVPDSLTSLGSEAFGWCPQLTDIYVSDVDHWLKIAGVNDAFSLNADTALHFAQALSGEYAIADGITAIPAYTFANQTDITKVTFPASIVSIGNSAFYGCTSLNEVEFLGTGSISMGQDVFDGCNNITNAIVPTSVVEMLPKTLTSLTIRQARTDLLVADSLAGMGRLEELTVDYLSIGSGFRTQIGALFGSEPFDGASAITQYLIDNTTLTPASVPLYIPDSLHTVTICKESAPGNCAFSGTKYIRNVYTLGTGSSSFGAYAFYDSGIEEYTVSDSIVEIGERAFQGASKLTTLTLGSGVVFIRAYAFADCTALESIVIPSAVGQIMPHAFEGCTSLTSVTFESGIEQWYRTSNPLESQGTVLSGDVAQGLTQYWLDEYVLNYIALNDYYGN